MNNLKTTLAPSSNRKITKDYVLHFSIAKAISTNSIYMLQTLTIPPEWENFDFMVRSEGQTNRSSALLWVTVGFVCFFLSCYTFWQSVMAEAPLLLPEVAGILSLLALASTINGLKLLTSKGSWYAATSRAIIIVRGKKVRTIGWQDFDHAQLISSSEQCKVRLAYRNKMKHSMDENIVLPKGAIDPQIIATICNRHIQNSSRKEKPEATPLAFTKLRPRLSWKN